jgi:hypothetical protein
MLATVIDRSTPSGAATLTGMQKASSGTAINASPKPKAERIRVATNTIIRTFNVRASIAASRTRF